jgi:hypothetical protein
MEAAAFTFAETITNNTRKPPKKNRWSTNGGTVGESKNLTVLLPHTPRLERNYFFR